jgi:hypothetical protein
VIRFLHENNGYISFQELNHYFPYINDQILKKIIKEINVEVDRNQNCQFTQEYNEEQYRSLITPENVRFLVKSGLDLPVRECSIWREHTQVSGHPGHYQC